MTERTRLKPADRRAELVTAALAVAARDGWGTLTHAAVAVQAGVSQGLVVKYLGTKPQMLRAVMREAVRTSVLPVVAEGLARRDPHALRCTQDLKDRAAAHVRGRA